MVSPQQLRRRRQGLDPEQRLCRRASPRYRYRQDRDLGAVQGRAKGKSHNIYDVIPDSKNNAYFTDFRQGQIGRIDAKTGEISFFQTPTPHSAPRRGNMDAQDRLWFAWIELAQDPGAYSIVVARTQNSFATANNSI